MLSLAEIIKTAQKLETKEQKVEWLKRNDSVPLRQLLIINYDTDRIKMLIPTTTPPYTKSEHLDSQGMLYNRIRQFKYFIDGEGVTNLSQFKREYLFIELLETIDSQDAEMVCQIIQQKPLTGLRVSVINEAFGEIIPAKFDADEEPAPKTKSPRKSKKADVPKV